MGKYFWMLSGVAQGEDRAAEVTRRIVRLFVLLGAAVAAYLVLSFFDHAARADSGSLGLPSGQVGATDPVGTVKATAAGAGKALRERKPTVPKSTAPKAHPPRIHRPTAKTPTVHAAKAQAAKKVQVQSVRVGKTVRRVQAQTPKPGRLPSGAVRHAARTTVTSARAAVARHELSKPIPLPSLPKPAAMPDLPRAELAASPRLPSWPRTQQAQLPDWPQLPGPQHTRLAAGPQVPGATQNRTPVLTQITALPSVAVSHQSASAPVCRFSQASARGLATPSAAPVQPRTVPLPAPPRQPGDQSTSTGQARDAGGSNGPAICTVSSSWRPEVVATGRRLAVEFVARGRTVRYAGPPS
ncbi:hypothetical protein ACIA5C_31775 [Actinoplanes sp. NPDC051343]|uniref:hypothetical protein n=1 Tax=Actinoplanes sp. NPDC051343 TaxID=3363906 RepID=UPI0037A9843F